MARLADIENRLEQINETVFQELCDSFLIRINNDYSVFSRIGSQSGKQKTTKGTPDSFFLLPSGKYLFIEHTTKSSGRKSKLESDIKSCLELAQSLKIPLSSISQIILCTNFNLSVSDVDELTKLLNGTSIDLKLYTLDSLSIEILFNHQELANKYLGLPLDKGQLVSIAQFVEEYNKASQGIATPLNNTFLHRETEKSQFFELLSTEDIIILSGKAGVGKTRVALNGIQEYLERDTNFEAYCVSNKHSSIIDELYQNIKKDTDTILFVDDANRIDSFKQILGFYKATREGRLKIVVTVRDYALSNIQRMCQEIGFRDIIVERFSDEQIKDIIKVDPFNVKNTEYQREIIRIADGNPRLAIMTSLLAIKKQNIQSLSDVSELFEKYFSTFVADNGELENEESLKFLAIISFFNKIWYKNRALVEPILAQFNLSFESFIESIDKLEKLELVEIRFDHVAISEQNLSMFFFYKAFIKDELLSFETLLDNFYEGFSSRFGDCVIHANNTFGPSKVMNKLKPKLEKYLSSIIGDYGRTTAFLKTFWFYLQEQTLELLVQIIRHSPEKISSFNNEASEVYTVDSINELLSNLYLTNNFEDALNLALDYIDYKPEHSYLVIDSILEKFKFSQNDQPTLFKRQAFLVNTWLTKVSIGKEVFIISFFKIVRKFLQFEFEHNRQERNNSVVIFNYPVPLSKEVKEIRGKIWGFLDSHFEAFDSESFFVINNYINSGLSKPSIDIVKFDSTYLLKIVQSKLKNSSLRDCHFVHELARWYDRFSLNTQKLESLKQNFTSSTYKLYLTLNIEDQYIRGENNTEGYSQFFEKKGQEIRDRFVFSSIEKFKEFYIQYSEIVDWDESRFNTLDSISLIINENFKKDSKLGIQILQLIVDEGNRINYIPSQCFRDNFDSEVTEKEVWSVISSRNFRLRFNWKILFFNFISHSEVSNVGLISLFFKKVGLKIGDNITTQDYLDLFAEITDPTTLFLDMHNRHYEKYPKLSHSVLKAINEKIEAQNLKIRLRSSFFIDNLSHLKNDFLQLRKGYLNQLELNRNFDLNGEALVEISKLDDKFLLKYVQAQYSTAKYGHPKSTMTLNKVWDIPSIENSLLIVFDWIIENVIDIGFNNQFCNVFFKSLNEHQEERARKFIQNYIRSNHWYPKKMNLIFDIILNSLDKYFEEFFISYLSLNPKKEDFSNIKWRKDSGAMWGGDVYFGEIRAREWNDLLSIIEDSDLGLDMIPVKNLIKSYISAEIEYAEEERRREYLRGF